jgi:hypothetical protein
VNTPAPRSRSWLRRLLAVFLGLLVALLICEGLIRLTGLGNVSLSRGSFHAFDPEAGWICRAGADTDYEQPGSFRVRVSVNSRGLRDREHALPKPAGTRRVVCLGDSFMWGYGVEEEEMLSRALEREVPGTETVNLGANGYSTVQELVRFETEGVRHSPDAVLLLVCWNDLEDNLDDKDGGRPAARVGEDGALSILNRPVRRKWKSSTVQWLRHNSRLFSFVEYAVKAARAKSARTAMDRGALEDAGDGLSEIDVYARPGPAMDAAWLVMGKVIERIRDEAARAGADLVVAYGADLYAVDAEAFADLARTAGAESDMDPDRPGRRLGEACARLGLRYLDLNPVFRASGLPVPDLFLAHNRHWSATGHLLAARALAPVLPAPEK